MPFLLCVACNLLPHGDSPAFPGIGSSDNHITPTQTAGVLGPAACSPHSPLSGFLSHCLGKVAAGKFGNCCNGFVSHFYML